LPKVYLLQLGTASSTDSSPGKLGKVRESQSEREKSGKTGKRINESINIRHIYTIQGAPKKFTP